LLFASLLSNMNPHVLISFIRGPIVLMGAIFEQRVLNSLNEYIVHLLHDSIIAFTWFNYL